MILEQLVSVLGSKSRIATKGCTEAQGWGCNLRPWWCLGCHDATSAIPISVPSASTQSQDAVLAQAAAEGHVWVHGPIAAGVCVDVHGLCAWSCVVDVLRLLLQDQPFSVFLQMYVSVMVSICCKMKFL